MQIWTADLPLRRRTLYPAELYPHMSDFVVLLGLILIFGDFWVELIYLIDFVYLKLCVILGSLAIFILFNAILRRRSLYPAELYPHIEFFECIDQLLNNALLLCTFAYWWTCSYILLWWTCSCIYYDVKTTLIVSKILFQVKKFI